MFVALVKYVQDSVSNVAVIYFLSFGQTGKARATTSSTSEFMIPSWYLSSLTKFGVSDFWGVSFYVCILP